MLLSWVACCVLFVVCSVLVVSCAVVRCSLFVVCLLFVIWRVLLLIVECCLLYVVWHVLSVVDCDGCCSSVLSVVCYSDVPLMC